MTLQDNIENDVYKSFQKSKYFDLIKNQKGNLSQEATKLRKLGKLDEALKIINSAIETDPENIWNKRAAAWVYYDFLKKHQNIDSIDQFNEYLAKIIELHLPQDEKMVFDNLAWQIGKMIFILSNEPEIKKQEIKGIFNAIKSFHFTKPGEGYSFLFKAFHKVSKDSQDYLELVNWFGLASFMPADFLQEEMKDGKKMMAFVEQVYIAYAKCLLEFNDTQAEEGILTFIDALEHIIEKHPEYQYPPYFKAKLLLKIGDKQNILSAILPFAKQKQSEFWVWEVLSEAFPENDERRLSCICKAMTCNTPDKFLLNIREKLATILINKNFLAEAKTEIEKIVQTRKDNGWPIPPKVKNWMVQPWFTVTTSNKNNLRFYSQFISKANEILFFDVPEQNIAVEFVNYDKKVLNFVAPEKISGHFKYDKFLSKVSIGDVLSVRLKNAGEEGWYKLLTVQKTTEAELKGVLNSFAGVVKIIDGKDYGFVENIFISPVIFTNHKLRVGDKIAGRAIISYNKQRREWVWKALIDSILIM